MSMMRDARQIGIWGLLDLCSLAWYLVLRLAQGKIPFLYDLARTINVAGSFESSIPMILATISCVLYLSLAVSGILLVTQRRSGTVLGFIQIPFRLLMFIPPSLFFITWPLKYAPGRTTFGIVMFIILVFCSEALKTISLVTWHKKRRAVT